jgi:predicted flap endonuclease-1-like 5' DNA nuclease
MRSDYMLYTVAVIFFILTGAVAAYSIEQQQLWIVTTAVLGLVFIGLGYTQRPKPMPTDSTPSLKAETTSIAVPTPPSPPAAQPTITETLKEERIEPPKTTAEKIEPVSETQLPTVDLIKIKGIKQRRASQLRMLGVNTLEDLAKASAEELGMKMQISPKITGKWIESAKEILAKS